MFEIGWLMLSGFVIGFTFAVGILAAIAIFGTKGAKFNEETIRLMKERNALDSDVVGCLQDIRREMEQHR